MTESLYSSHLSVGTGIGVSTRYPVRLALAEVLRAASRTLAHMASRLSAAEVSRDGAAISSDSISPLIEFYAEAGAAEDALFADGKLVGYLPVSRP